MTGTVGDVITRPNGKAYRPRRLDTVNFSAFWVSDDFCCGVFVFGTHDVDHARDLASQAIDHGWPVKPECGWWRDGYDGGERAWITDEVRGRAGVRFTCSDDPPAEAVST